jgi:drug/metabolite transporter (DMT)-like permease
MLGQSTGLIFSRMGIGSADPVQATMFRALAGLIGFTFLFSLMGIWPQVGRALRQKKAMAQVSLGSVFGPFIGVALMLYALQHTTAGILAIITALVPVVVIAPSMILFGEKITPREVLGALIAVGGVALLFI